MNKKLLVLLVFVLLSVAGCFLSSDHDYVPSVYTDAPAPVDTSARLTWDAVFDSRLAGYRVYYGKASRTYLQPAEQGVHVGTNTTYTITNLDRNTRYYFTVVSFDGSNTESIYSNEVFKDIL